MRLQRTGISGLSALLAAAAAFAAHAAASPVPAPTVAVAVTRVVPGMSVQVSGEGFTSGEPLTVSLDGSDVLTATANSKEAFSVTMRIAADEAAGSHTVAVAGQDGSAATQITVGAPDPAQLIDTSFPSTELAGDLGLVVYLPPGYNTGTERYPVIYFLHGLPAGQSAYRSWGGVLSRALGAVGSPAIAVMPQAARDGDQDPEYLDWGEARNWQTAIGKELPAYVDAHFRTIPDRSGRALVGVSAGGYGAITVGLSHLLSFSVLESWSGYFEPTNPSGTKPLHLGSAAADAAATAYTLIPKLARTFEREPTFLGFYVGDQDTLFNADNIRFHRRLVAAAVPHSFAHYPGGHQTSVWSTHAVQWLSLAVAHLAAPR